MFHTKIVWLKRGRITLILILKKYLFQDKTITLISNGVL